MRKDFGFTRKPRKQENLGVLEIQEILETLEQLESLV